MGGGAVLERITNTMGYTLPNSSTRLGKIDKNKNIGDRYHAVGGGGSARKNSIATNVCMEEGAMEWDVTGKYTRPTHLEINNKNRGHKDKKIVKEVIEIPLGIQDGYINETAHKEGLNRGGGHQMKRNINTKEYMLPKPLFDTGKSLTYKHNESNSYAQGGIRCRK